MRTKYHTQYNWEFVALSLTLLASFVLAFFLIVKAVVYGYEKITLFNEQLDASRLINKRYDTIFNMTMNADYKFLTKCQMDERKKIYDDEQLAFQKESLLKVETEISKELCPVGTYVYLKETSDAVRVKYLNGYQAFTYEGICFMTIDTDSWYTLSYREYELCKKVEEMRKDNNYAKDISE